MPFPDRRGGGGGGCNAIMVNVRSSKETRKFLVVVTFLRRGIPNS